MRGRFLLLAGGGALAIFTGLLWYFQFYAFYEDLAEQPLVIGGTSYPVEHWQGIDASSSPLKRRVCLQVSEPVAGQISAEQTALAEAEPLVAPDWFECFNAKQIARDLEAGKAQAFALGASGFEGLDDVFALYPDGRGYLWRQLQERYRNQ